MTNPTEMLVKMNEIMQKRARAMSAVELKSKALEHAAMYGDDKEIEEKRQELLASFEAQIDIALGCYKDVRALISEV